MALKTHQVKEAVGHHLQAVQIRAIADGAIPITMPNECPFTASKVLDTKDTPKTTTNNNKGGGGGGGHARR